MKRLFVVVVAAILTACSTNTVICGNTTVTVDGARVVSSACEGNEISIQLESERTSLDLFYADETIFWTPPEGYSCNIYCGGKEGSGAILNPVEERGFVRASGFSSYTMNCIDSQGVVIKAITTP